MRHAFASCSLLTQSHLRESELMTNVAKRAHPYEEVPYEVYKMEDF